MRALLALGLLAGCGGCPRPAAEEVNASPADDAGVALVSAVAMTAPADAAPAPLPERWLKGTLHVHALPSGDSATPIPEVIAYYRTRGYDFIALTDHNRMSEIGEGRDTTGSPAVALAEDTGGLIVLAGSELTSNPASCEPPPPEPDGKCRLHVNVIGAIARPPGKITWSQGTGPKRIDTYQAAIDRAREWGGLVQINHPQWHWGMSGELLTELGRRGALLVEVGNRQFQRWLDGDERHPSIETLWDQALSAGVTIWGTVNDDAHDYQDDGGGRYPAGGAWVMVKSAPEPAALVAAIAAGRFYGSTGVVLRTAEVIDGALVVEVDGEGAEADDVMIRFVADGKVVQEVEGARAAQPIAGFGYVRAVVTRKDGARAWVQPVRP